MADSEIDAESSPWCLPRCTLVRSWNPELSQDLNPGTQIWDATASAAMPEAGPSECTDAVRASAPGEPLCLPNLLSFSLALAIRWTRKEEVGKITDG